MVGCPRAGLPGYTLTSLLPRSWLSSDRWRRAAGITSSTPSGSMAREVRGGTVARPAALSVNALSSASMTSRGVSTRSRSARERMSTLACVTRARRDLGAANHALDARLQHHLAALVQDTVGVRHDAAIRFSGLTLFHHLDLDPHGVAFEYGRDHADLPTQPGHTGAVDETGLHDEPFGERERQRPRRGPPPEDGFLLNELHVHEEWLRETALVHEVDDVGLGHRTRQRVIPSPDRVLLEGQSASQHVGPSSFGYPVTRSGARSLAKIGPTDVGILAQLGGAAGQHDRAGLQHVAAMGDLERHRRVLLDQQNGRALSVDVHDRREDLLDEHRCQAHA